MTTRKRKPVAVPKKDQLPADPEQRYELVTRLLTAAERAEQWTATAALGRLWVDVSREVEVHRAQVREQTPDDPAQALEDLAEVVAHLPEQQLAALRQAVARRQPLRAL